MRLRVSARLTASELHVTRHGCIVYVCLLCMFCSYWANPQLTVIAIARHLLSTHTHHTSPHITSIVTWSWQCHRDVRIVVTWSWISERRRSYGDGYSLRMYGGRPVGCHWGFMFFHQTWLSKVTAGLMLQTWLSKVIKCPRTCLRDAGQVKCSPF